MYPRILLTLSLLTLSLLVAVLPTSAAGRDSGEGAAVHPLLQPLVENPREEIPAFLQTEIAGEQGRHRIAGRAALSLHLLTDVQREELEALGARVRTWAPGRATVDLLPERLVDLARLPAVYSISLPKKVEKILETSVPNTGVDHLRTESGGVFSGNTGAGVIVGVIDSGIDLNHPNFRDPINNTTRLLYVLDQTDNDAECDSMAINMNQCSQTDGPSGHGTHVTGIAAGNGAAANAAGNVYETVGMAPNADIIVVKSTLVTDDIEEAITYIFDKADALGMPAVINLSLGYQLGAHDGTESLEQHIDTMVTAQPGRAVVISAGNSRQDEIHAEVATIASLSVVGPEFEIQNTGSFLAITGYYPDGDDLIVHLWSPTGDYLTRPLGSSNLCQQANTASGSIWLCNSSVPTWGGATAANEIIVLVTDDAGVAPGIGTWKMALSGMTVAGGKGQADFWMSSEMSARFTSHVDEEETLGMPSTAEHGIAVGSHNTKVCWQDESDTAQSYDAFGISTLLSDISWFSSWGPTRDGREKPDLTAPGTGIVSARAATASMNPVFYINSDYLLMQGTSQAAPHVAGAIALLLENDPSLTAAAIKTLLRDTTSESYFSHYTGPTNGAWNPVFGEGLLDFGFLGPDPWETNDQLRHARRVLSGEAIEAYIGEPGDEDFYQVRGMIPGDTLSADLTSLPANYDLELHAVWSVGIACHNSGPVSDKEAWSYNSGTTAESAAVSLPTWTADYMRVFPVGGAFDAVDPYSLVGVVTRQEIGTVHNNTGSAQPLPEFVKFKVAGSTFMVGEKDYYSFFAKQGDAITVQSTSGPHVVEILNPSGTPQGATYTAMIDGTHYVRVTRTGGGGLPNYLVQINLN